MDDSTLMAESEEDLKSLLMKVKEESEKVGLKLNIRARFGSTYTKIGTIQRRLAWPLRKDDTQIHEAFHIFRWMKLEPIIQSEVSQKEKHQYSILTHIYGI